MPRTSVSCEQAGFDQPKKVTGKKKELKETQEYPKGYADEVCRGFENHQQQTAVEVESDSSESDYEAHSADNWADAELTEVEKIVLTLTGTEPFDV